MSFCALWLVVLWEQTHVIACLIKSQHGLRSTRFPFDVSNSKMQTTATCNQSEYKTMWKNHNIQNHSKTEVISTACWFVNSFTSTKTVFTNFIIEFSITSKISTRWPFRKRTPQGPPIYTVEMQCDNRRAKGAELDSAAASKRSRCSVWHEAGAYII